MLVTTEIEKYLEEVRAFADKVGKRENLEDKLKYLGNYACNGDRPQDYTRCILSKDYAPYSFYFVMQVKEKDGSYKFWFNGGLIFHGQHDGGGNGGAPTFSVCLTPTDGWAIHT